VPSREQSSLVFQEYEDRLEKAMEARLHLFQFLLFTNLLYFIDHSAAVTSFG
jgi:hypothetical protein